MWASYGDAMHDDGERRPTDADQIETPESIQDAIDLNVFLTDKVVRHRAAKMAKAGLNARQARTLALDKTVDSHAVVAVLEKGCDPETAFDIFS